MHLTRRPGRVQSFILGALSVVLLQIAYQWLHPLANWALHPPIESIMKLAGVSSSFTSLASFSASTILQNGQVRKTHFLDTKIDRIDANSTAWKTYSANATEISYKGRWDSKHISWWAYVLVIFLQTHDKNPTSYLCKLSYDENFLNAQFPLCVLLYV